MRLYRRYRPEGYRAEMPRRMQTEGRCESIDTCMAPSSVVRSPREGGDVVTNPGETSPTLRELGRGPPSGFSDLISHRTRSDIRFRSRLWSEFERTTKGLQTRPNRDYMNSERLTFARHSNLHWSGSSARQSQKYPRNSPQNALTVICMCNLCLQISRLLEEIAKLDRVVVFDYGHPPATIPG